MNIKVLTKLLIKLASYKSWKGSIIDSDLIKCYETSACSSSACSNVLLSSSPYVTLRATEAKQNKLMIQHLLKIQLCSLYCSHTHYPGLWRMTAFKLHRQKSKITLQFIPNSRRPATDVCVNLSVQSEDMHCLTSNPIRTTERSGWCLLRACGRRDGYIHIKKCVRQGVCVCLHLLSVSLYEPSMSKWGRVKPCKH